MASRKVLLKFPRETVNSPITYHLVKDFDLVPNIFRARVSEEEAGRLYVELQGSRKNLDRAFRFLRKEGIGVEPLAKDVSLDKEKCVDCSLCTAICPTGALHLEKGSDKIKFDKKKCIACGLCVDACPYNAISVKF